MSSKSLRIVGMGAYLPEQIVTNHDLISKGMVTTDEWIQSRTGIQQRHVSDERETTSYMAAESAKKALAMAGLLKDDVDLIIVATSTAEYAFPSTACLVQDQLDISNCAAFDINAACSGFIYALEMAEKLMRAGSYRTVLVIGSERMTRCLNWEDRSTAILFGDGAGACVLVATDENRLFETTLYSQGKYHSYLRTPRLYPDKKIEGSVTLEMKGKEVFKMAVHFLSLMVEETLDRHQLRKEELDWLIPHQANIRILQAVSEKTKFPLEKIVQTIHIHANTSAASIPLAMMVAYERGELKPEQLILLEAFGGGFVWGSTLLRL